MGLWSAVKAAATGDFANAGNYLFIDEDAITTTREVAAAQEKILERQQADGIVSADEASKFLYEIQMSSHPWSELFGEPGASPMAGFAEGIKDGATNVGKFVNKSITTATSITARIIPWWVWVIGAVGLAIWLAPYVKLYLATFKRK